MTATPDLIKGGLLRRGFALLVDLVIVEILMQVLAVAAYPVSNGVVIDTNSLFISCTTTWFRPVGLDVPADFDRSNDRECTKNLLGWPTAHLFVVSRRDASTGLTTSLNYALDRNGRPAPAFDLGLLQPFALVLMRWLLECRGRRSLGRRWLSLTLLPRAAEGRRERTYAAVTRRYLWFALPFLPALVLQVVRFGSEFFGGRMPADIVPVVTFIGTLPPSMAVLVALGAILRRRDAFYDEAAGTSVARIIDGTVQVAPERAPGLIRQWSGRLAPPETGHAIRRLFPWASLAITAILAILYGAEILYPFGKTHPIGVTSLTLVLFGGMSQELVQLGGQWYRLLTAIFLHASTPHLVANVIVLLAAGFFLEGVFGRGWFLATFLLGGLAGSLASVTFNAPDLLSIGASGAVTALLGAGLVVSFGLIDDTRRLWLRAFCVACLFAALQATGTFAWGTIDRADHVGGALGGALIGLLILASWKRDKTSPSWHRPAVAAAILVSAALFVSVPLAGWGDLSLKMLLIPDSQLPRTDEDWIARSADLVKRYPRDPRGYLARATAAGEDQGERERQMTLAIAAQLRLTPGPVQPFAQQAYTAIGIARGKARDWPAARDLFSRAIALAPPGTPDALEGRVNAEEALGQFDQALADLRTISRLRPSSAAPHLEIADALFAKGEPDQAVSELDAALGLAPNDPMALRQRGWIGFFDKRGDQALRDLERAASLLPKDAYAALWLDIVAVRSGSDDRLAANVGRLDLGVWPGPIVKFYQRQIDRDALMRAADRDPDKTKQSDQRCEAYFYYGEWQLMQHADRDAEPYLAAALSDCPKTFYEWAAVQAEINGSAGSHTGQENVRP